MARKNSDYTIATRLTLSGEKEFNAAMKQAAETTKNLNADMDLAKSKYAATGDETEYLAEKLRILGAQLENKRSQWQTMNDQLGKVATKSAQAEEKVRQLEEQLAQTPKGTAEWNKLKEELDRAKLASTKTSTELKRLKSATQETEKATYDLQAEINATTEAQEKLGQQSDDTGRKIANNLGDAAEEAQSKFQRMAQSIQQDLGSIKNMKKLSIAIDLVRGAWDVGNQIYSYVADSTREGMEQAKTDYNITASGGSVERGRALVTEYGAIFGDTGSAREAATNLAAMNLSAENYEKAAKAIGGAAIKFQDTLKVEGLADSLQESLSTGAMTGPMAEFFERMESQTGLSLETVNAGLAEAKKAEEAGMAGAAEKAMMAYIDATGMGDYYEGFKKQNENLFQAAEATKSIEQTVAEIGTELATTVAPLLGTVAKEILPPIKTTVEGIAKFLNPWSSSGYTEEDREIDAQAVLNDYKKIYGAEEGEKKYNQMLAEQEATIDKEAEEYRKTVGTPAGAAKYNAEAETLGEKIAITVDYLGYRMLELFGMSSAGGEELQADATPNRDSWPTATGNPKTTGSQTTISPWLQYRTAPDKTKLAWQVRAQWGGRAAGTAAQANVAGATDLGAISQQMDDLTTKGAETGQGIMHQMSEGMRQKLQELQTVQENARQMMDNIWNPAIESTVVIGYKMGAGLGPINQNLTVELQPQPVQLDGMTVTKILRDPVNIMLNKLVESNR